MRKIKERMIEVIHNPKTPQYFQIKEWVCGGWIPWYWEDGTTLDRPDGLLENGHENFGFSCHTLLSRPGEKPYSVESSPYLDKVYPIFSEIFEANNLNVNVIYRIGINCVHPTDRNLPCIEHIDHNFPHKNLLIYMSNTDGDTVVEGERHSPVEDEIIIFEGKHYHHPPTFGRRIAMVATFA